MKPLYSEVGQWCGLHDIKIGASEGLKQINNLIRLIHKINSSLIILTVRLSLLVDKMCFRLV